MERAMTVELIDHDIAEFIETKEDAAMFLQAAFEEAPDDPSFIQHVLGQIGRGLGMTALAEELGVTRASLYKSLNRDGNPSFKTIYELLRFCGGEITFPDVKEKVAA